MQSDLVNTEQRPVAVNTAAENRLARPARYLHPDAVSKVDQRREEWVKSRLPTPTRGHSSGPTPTPRNPTRLAAPPPRHTSSKSPGPYGHSSAPAGIGRPRQNRSHIAPPPRHAASQQAIRIKTPSPEIVTTSQSISTASRRKSPINPTVPDYSALSSLTDIMSRGRNQRPMADRTHEGMSPPIVYNNLNKISSVDSTTRNNASALVLEEDDYDNLFKIGAPVSDNVTWDARRRFKSPTSSNSPVSKTPFAQLNEETEDYNQESPSASLLRRSESASQPKDTKQLLWSRLKQTRSRDLPKTPVGTLLGLMRRSSEDGDSGLSEPSKDLDVVVTSPKSNFSEPGSESAERFLRTAGRYFGIPLGRRKSKASDTSAETPFSSKSEKPKKKKMPKMARKLCKAVGKRLLQKDDKTINLKNVVHGVLSLQACSVDNVVTAQERLIRGKSTSSENSSDTGSSIDMNDIKMADPELYATIVETVASWCDPTAEPEHLEAVSRTFSTISFRDRPHAASQDLSNFEVNPALAREEAFLRDVIEGRIRAESSCSDSPRKRDIHQSASAPACSTQRRSENDRVCGSEMERILDAIDNLCTPKKCADASDAVSEVSDVNCPVQSAFLSFLDSGSEDEDVERPKNDFLHLTSSEIEQVEMNGMKEVLRMQGIWMFNWDRCAEIMSLPEKWKQSPCLQKYTDGARGIEIAVDEQTVRSYRYPLNQTETDEPIEHVFLDGVPSSCTSSTLNLKGTLTTRGLRTKCTFPDGSQREELVWIERDGLCVQVSVELSTRERNVSRVYLKRPIFS